MLNKDQEPTKPLPRRRVLLGMLTGVAALIAASLSEVSGQGTSEPAPPIPRAKPLLAPEPTATLTHVPEPTATIIPAAFRLSPP